MKKHILLSLLLVVAFQSNAQVWGNLGAKWHYVYSSFDVGLLTVTYEMDTILGGETAQKLKVSDQVFFWQSNGGLNAGPVSSWYNYTRYSGDSVFWWHDNQYFLMYDFGASVGDIWVVGTGNGGDPFCDSVSKVEVVGTGTMTIN